MTSVDSDGFWESSAVHVALPPHLSDDGGLAEWATGHDEAASLLFFQTSGSEGQAKWVGLSRDAFLASAKAVNTHLRATRQDRWLLGLPLHHVGGFSILARCHASGASFTRYTQRWSAQDFANQCEADKITLTSLVPTQVFDLVQAGLRAPSTLRAVIVGGGAMSAPLGVRARELGWPVLQSYGMTEACSQIATESLDHLSEGFDPEALEVLPHWLLSVDADEHLVVKGAALAEGFAFQSAGSWSWQRIAPEVGLVTRDRVRLWSDDSRQWLRFLGRESSFVKIKGELVSLVTVQRKIDEIAHACSIRWPLVVCALPDERRETRLILVAQQGQILAPTLEEIVGLHTTSCPVAERILGTHLVEALPYAGPGKINMAALQSLLREAFNLQ